MLLTCAHHLMSITPAPNNTNLRVLADHVQASLLFAHIRATSGAAISEENCHPFVFGRWMFMHNGAVSHFLRVKRKLVQSIPDDIFYAIKGATDSEHVFALFLDLLGKSRDDPNITPHIMRDTLIKTIHVLVSLVKVTEEPSDEHQFSSLNFVVTNGKIVVASRYRDGPEDPPSLYYHTFEKYELIEGHAAVHPIKDDEKPGAVIIASEPVTDDPDPWFLLPKNSIITCLEDNTIDVQEITETDMEKNFREWSERTEKSERS